MIFKDKDGRPVTPRTKGQERIVQASHNNTIVFVQGPAGTGKTFVPLALGLAELTEANIDRLVLTRPAIQAGEDIGFLPGELDEKITPYMAPFMNNMNQLIGKEKHAEYVRDDVICYEPLGFLRGVTLDKCCVILDEAQNATEHQLKMLLTRIGPRATVFVTGDPNQTDLRPKNKSALFSADAKLAQVNDIGFVYLDVEDIVRHRIVRDIIQAYQY